MNGRFRKPRVNGTLFFAADHVVYGNELWRSNGTAVGTTLVKDINPTGASTPSWLTPVGGSLFFVAANGVHGAELWKSNGISAGTVLVKDINPGSSDSFSAVMNDLADVNGVLFFTADDGSHGVELWKSNGTQVGTVPVKDIRPGSGESGIYYLTALGGVVYFQANDGVSGRELWQSDGTAVPEYITSDTTWSEGGNLYLADVRVIVNEGVTVRLGSGQQQTAAVCAVSPTGQPNRNT